MRERRSARLLFLTAALFSLTALPAAAAALPAGVSEYMARFAAGRLFVPYSALESRRTAAGSAAPYCAKRPVTPSGAESPAETQGAAHDGKRKAVPVSAVDLSRIEKGKPPKLLAMNETRYKISPPSAADTPLTIGRGAVLILHTHGTEAYLPAGEERCFGDESFRSRDRTRNVVAIGEEFASVLREAGIEVYHDRAMYDEQSFRNAYGASRKAAKSRLAKQPEICYIIDIHRDAVTGSDGTARKTLCRINGEDCAQVMLVVGTDEAGADHANWRDNLCVASKYQRQLNAYPGLARPIYLRRSSYNQQLCRGALLLEIGSAGNTVEEAGRAAVLAAHCFVKLYRELE